MPFCICIVKQFWGERRVFLCGGLAAAGGLHTQGAAAASPAAALNNPSHTQPFTLAQCLQCIYAGWWQRGSLLGLHLTGKIMRGARACHTHFNSDETAPRHKTLHCCPKASFAVPARWKAKHRPLCPPEWHWKVLTPARAPGRLPASRTLSRRPAGSMSVGFPRDGLNSPTPSHSPSMSDSGCVRALGCGNEFS